MDERGVLGEVSGLSTEQIARIKLEALKESVVCSICLEDIEKGDLGKIIPGCLHKFHEPCIAPWLTNNAFCPYCRNGITGTIGN